MIWNIVCDSSCDLKDTYLKHDNIGFETIPLKILIGEKEYIDTDDVDVVSMLHDMHAHKKASLSACPSPGDFAEAFKKADNTICITMTGALSGTNNSAQLARNLVLEDHPEKNIFVIDSKATAGVLVLLMRKAIELIEQNHSFEEVTKQLEAYNNEIQLCFTLFSFDNLVKTGRMNALAGTLIKSIGVCAIAQNTVEGTIDVVKKVRGERRAMKSMVDIISEKKAMTNLPVVISHCLNEEAANSLKEIIREKLNTTDITILKCKALTSFYSLEKGILVAF